MMNNALKSLENNALAALTQRAPQHIVSAIQTASAKTGVSFSYLMEKAAAESNFNPTVKAKTSSATGLFQFIESTWMDMVGKHGEKHGIDTTQSKTTLLNLRKNPTIASVMAAEFAADNKSHLKQRIGGDIGNTELYFAHFMGAGGASSFLSELHKNPTAIGADMFPKAAHANQGVFYDKDGSARSLEDIYKFFDKKFSDDSTPTTELATMAHKPNKSAAKSIDKAGYQHIPFSLKKPIEIIEAQNTSAFNSLYQIENNLNAFFSQPVNSSFEVSSLYGYGAIKNPSSSLLSVLR
jgi:hypothetical protein